MDAIPLALGVLRAASGVPLITQDPEPDQVTSLLTVRRLRRSVAYREAVLGVGMAAAAAASRDTRWWFAAAAGAHAMDLLDGFVVDDDEPVGPQATALAGAVIGVALGCWGFRRQQPSPSTTD